MIEQQIRVDDQRWDTLDRTSNPRAFMEQQAIAECRERLLIQADAKRTQIAPAEQRRAALVALNDILEAIDQQIDHASQQFYADVMTASKSQRRARLESLDGLLRARARIAAPLAGVAAAVRRFRRQPDPLSALTNDLRARADEIDRALGPGMPRAPIAWPEGAQALIATLNEGRSV
jgi:hypothetical protein